ncbi:hypothetical protein NKG95_07590 [Mesorhizobium sp. M1423]|uniref:hypothetical protein n=1 Tax=Mesorhizobium sp. M1423 TaxID=2957101 RepID=UPI00333A2ACA
MAARISVLPKTVHEKIHFEVNSGHPVAAMIAESALLKSLVVLTFTYFVFDKRATRVRRAAVATVHETTRYLASG